MSKERLALQQPSSERSSLKKGLDTLGYAAAFVTLPLGLYFGTQAILGGAYLKAGIAYGFAFLDYTQIKEHGRDPKDQSLHNPERLTDKVFNFFSKGRERFAAPPSPSLVRAATA